MSRLVANIVATILVVAPCLRPEPVAACSFRPSTYAFRPSLQGFDWHPADKSASATVVRRESVPAPVVTVMEITRGGLADPTTCGDTAVLRFSVALPPSSTYNLDQFGVYLRKLSGRVPEGVFPTVPLKAPVADGRSQLLFFWLEGTPRVPPPLDLKLEVFFVTDGLDIGPSAIVEVE